MSNWPKTPIPDLIGAKSALDYHQIPINVSGTANQEPLVDAAEHGIACVSIYSQTNTLYKRAFDSALKSVFVRAGVLKRLLEINKRLADYGVELLLLDGYRPIELQRELWQHFLSEAKRELLNPTELECTEFAGRFCSDPSSYNIDDFRTWPVHKTGGAIDLTLRDLVSKSELNMGGTFDEASERSTTRVYENIDNSEESKAKARGNRRLLFNAMSSGDFVNYHHEWWHYDFGTQMWVMNGNLNVDAIYGDTELD